MDLPLNLVVKNIEDTFKSNKLYLFKNINFSTNSPSHYHIALSTKDGKYIVLSMITSQVDKKIKYYNLTNKALIKGIVSISNNELSLLDRDSCIDCNQPMYVTNEELIALVKDEIKFINIKIESSLKNKIIKAIKASDMVRDEIKGNIVDD